MACVTALIALAPIVIAAAQAIPDDQIQKNRIFYGTPTAFENPAEVNMDEALQATPEFQEIVKKKVDHGTAKYWILVSDATDRVHRAISEVGRGTDYDLIVDQGYLEEVQPPVPCDDITAAVIDRIAAE